MSQKLLFFLNFLLLLICLVRAEDEDESKIVGGRPTDITRIPYQVVVLNGNSVCGGSVIRAKWIVTAAHCVRGAVARALKVRVGTNTASGGSLQIVTDKFAHPAYDPATERNDIALLKLKNNLPLSGRVRIIPLANRVPGDGSSILISGYGRTSNNGPMAQSLLSTSVNLVNLDVCIKAYGATKITRGMFCASTPGKDACQGDSGGPAVFNNQLVGVVSWGIGCASPRFPGVYSSIPFFRAWIDRTIQSSP